MAGRRPVRAAENLGRNLDSLRQFLDDAGAPEAFDVLLDELFEGTIPHLAAFPEAGFDFLSRRPGSREAAAAVARWE